MGSRGAAAEIERPSLSSNAREGICEGSRPGPWGGAPAPRRPRVCPSLLCRSCRRRPWRSVRASSSLKQQLGLIAKESGVRQGLGQFSSRTGAQKDAQDTVPAFEGLSFWQGTSGHCQSESNHMLRGMWGAPAEGFLGGGEECTRRSRG